MSAACQMASSASADHCRRRSWRLLSRGLAFDPVGHLGVFTTIAVAVVHDDRSDEDVLP